MKKRLFVTTKKDMELLDRLEDAENDELKDAVNHARFDAWWAGGITATACIVTTLLAIKAALYVSDKVTEGMSKALDEIWMDEINNSQ